MKKSLKTNLILVLILIVSMLFIFAGNVKAEVSYSDEKVTDDGIRYVIYTASYTGSEVIVKGLEDGSNITNLTIPAQIEGIDVKQIEEKAFANNTNLVKVVFPNTMNSVGAEAFSGCTNLKEVELNGYDLNLMGKVFYGTLIETLKFTSTGTGNCGFKSTSFEGMNNLKYIYFELKDSVWGWDHEEYETEFTDNCLEYFRNNVTIYGYSCTYEEDDATNAVTLSPKGFATKRGIKFVDLDTLEEQSLTDEEYNVTVYANMSALAKLTITKLDEDSADYKEMASKLENSDIVFSCDISLRPADYEGLIEVRIPVETKYNGKTATILHKKANGTVETLTSVAKDGYVSIKVRELSPFVVSFEKEVEIAEQEEETEQTEQETETTTTTETTESEKDETPKTGEVDLIYSVMVVAALAGIGIVLLKIRK